MGFRTFSAETAPWTVRPIAPYRRAGDFLKQIARGRGPAYLGRRAGLAQLVEHVICNHGVAGSIPAAGTK